MLNPESRIPGVFSLNTINYFDQKWGTSSYNDS